MPDEDKVKELVGIAIKERNVKFLANYFFSFNPTPGQEIIIRAIAFAQFKRIQISAYTRYGKTQCVAIGVGLYIMFNNNKKIALIAPESAQTDILRTYLSEAIMRCEQLRALADFDKKKDYRALMKEASKTRQTFKNGCEWRVFSAHGEAFRIMGFGANLIIKDEAARISRIANAKIFRMLGDDAKNAVMVELTNPWDSDSVAYEHWINPRWKTIHINWKQGIAEGRHTKEFFDEARDEVSPIEWEVLYESNYPDEAVDSLIRLIWVKRAQEKELVSKAIRKKYLGCDIAEAGIDWTVAIPTWETTEAEYNIIDIFSWHKSDTMVTAEDIRELNNSYKGVDQLKIDSIGVGKGVHDALIQMRSQGKLLRAQIKGIRVGESPTIKREKGGYANKKAQYYWNLRTLFESGKIKLPNPDDPDLCPRLRKNARILQQQILAMKYEKAPGTEKIRIIDPEKSPDYADALMLACSPSEGGLVL